MWLSVASACPTPRFPSTPVEGGVVAWIIGGPDGLASLKRNRATISVISPAYYSVRVSGSTTRLVEWDRNNPVDRRAMSAIAKRSPRRPLVPLVACLGSCAKALSPLLGDPRARSQHAKMLVERLVRDGVDGLFIDYEGLRCAPAAFSAFVAELSRLLAPRGAKLGVAITEPCGPPPRCARPNYPFEIDRLARLADYLAVMEYDYTVDGSGPVAPRKWVTDGLKRVRREAAANLRKIYVSLPLYGRITAELVADNGVLWSAVNAKRLAGKTLRVIEQRYDPSALSQIGSVTLDGKPGRLYYEDHQTLRERLRLVEASGFSNIALWRLGGADPRVFDEIASWRAGHLRRR